MPAQTLPFPGQQPSLASPIARYLRIGNNHAQSAGRHAGGRLPVDRVVFDASRFKQRRDVVVDLREADVHLVLDTEAAESATLAKFEGHARHAPWALSALEKVPDLLRAHHVLNGPLVKAETLSRNLGELRPSQAVAEEKNIDKAKLMDRICKKARMRAQVGTVLRCMDEQRGGEWTRSRPIARQQSPAPLFRRGRP